MFAAMQLEMSLYEKPLDFVAKMNSLTRQAVANPDPDFYYWMALRGIWGRVQESKVYGIKSAMVGNFLGFQFTGQSGIYGPLEITSGRNGIIAEAKSFDREDMVVAELNLNALVGLKDNLDPRRELWERYFPQAYYFI